MCNQRLVHHWTLPVYFWTGVDHLHGKLTIACCVQDGFIMKTNVKTLKESGMEGHTGRPATCGALWRMPLLLKDILLAQAAARMCGALEQFVTEVVVEGQGLTLVPAKTLIPLAESCCTTRLPVLPVAPATNTCTVVGT